MEYSEHTDGSLGTRIEGINGSTVLVATSWTAELLAPAYKKSVYVKEHGANVTLIDGKTLLKTPFAGSTQKVFFKLQLRLVTTLSFTRLLTTQVLL